MPEGAPDQFWQLYEPMPMTDSGVLELGLGVHG